MAESGFFDQTASDRQLRLNYLQKALSQDSLGQSVTFS
jgi:hypothetical protein